MLKRSFNLTEKFSAFVFGEKVSPVVFSVYLESIARYLGLQGCFNVWVGSVTFYEIRYSGIDSNFLNPFKNFLLFLDS